MYWSTAQAKKCDYLVATFVLNDYALSHFLVYDIIYVTTTGEVNNIVKKNLRWLSSRRVRSPTFFTHCSLQIISNSEIICLSPVCKIIAIYPQKQSKVQIRGASGPLEKLQLAFLPVVNLLIMRCILDHCPAVEARFLSVSISLPTASHSDTKFADILV